jgi:predicted dehydrogenase
MGESKSGRPWRVGIVGLQPGRSWAALAHVPALRSLPDDFEIAGVANTSRASAEAAAAECGLPRAFANVQALVTSPDVDVVAVTVKVAHHEAIVDAALDAGKHVYCEWPLGNGLPQARAMVERARQAGVRTAIGTQAMFAPEVVRLRELLACGYVGEVYSTSLLGTGMNWGAEVQQANAYTLDRRQGATMMSIPLGHTLAALMSALGPVAELSALTAQRRASGFNVDTGQSLPMSAEDQVLVSGMLASGAPISVHFRGGMAHGSGLLWEINGSEGDLRLSGPGGHTQFVPLSLSGARGEEPAVAPLALPDVLAGDTVDGPRVGNVRRLYAAFARDLREGSSLAPDFACALDIHRVLAAIELSAATGQRVRPADL